MSSDLLRATEAALERALHQYEQRGQPAAALAIYREALAGLDPDETDREIARLRAHTLMRIANTLTEMDRPDEAADQATAALDAAVLSGDEITIARAHMALAATLLGLQRLDEGLRHLRQAASSFAAGETSDHHEGLGWLHILQAEVRAMGILASAPREVVERAEQALLRLRPLSIWSGIERAHAVRAGAWDQYGWHELWRRFEEEARLVHGWAALREPQAAFVARVPSLPWREFLGPIRRAVAPFHHLFTLLPDHALHIPLQWLGPVPALGGPRHATPDLATLQSITPGALRGSPPCTVDVADVNAFPDRLWLQLHDTDGQLAVLRDRVRTVANMPPFPRRELVPHLPIAMATDTAPVPMPLYQALLPFRDWPVGTIEIEAVDLIVLDPDDPAAPLDVVASFPLAQ